MVLTVTIGGSTLGYSRTPRKRKPITPNRTIRIESTIERTGRLMQTDGRFIAPFRSLPRPRSSNRLAIGELQQAA